MEFKQLDSFCYNKGTVDILYFKDNTSAYIEHRGLQTMYDLGLLEPNAEFFCEITDYGTIESVCTVDEYYEAENENFNHISKNLKEALNLVIKVDMDEIKDWVPSVDELAIIKIYCKDISRICGYILEVIEDKIKK